MNKKYKNYINKNKKWHEIIIDKFNISKSHNISSNRRKNLYTKIKEDEILSLNEWYKDITFIYVPYVISDKYVFNQMIYKQISDITSSYFVNMLVSMKGLVYKSRLPDMNLKMIFLIL